MRLNPRSEGREAGRRRGKDDVHPERAAIAEPDDLRLGSLICGVIGRFRSGRKLQHVVQPAKEPFEVRGRRRHPPYAADCSLDAVELFFAAFVPRTKTPPKFSPSCNFEFFGHLRGQGSSRCRRRVEASRATCPRRRSSSWGGRSLRRRGPLESARLHHGAPAGDATPSRCGLNFQRSCSPS